jgi:hypothetical protein
MSIERVTITPEKAKEILRLNTGNRPLALSHVKRLATAMRNGEWAFCGDAIRISTENVLLDGQHRLHAIVDSGVTIDMVLITNLPPETFHVIDTNVRKRSTADVLAISGEQNCNVLAAALAVVYAYELGDELTMHRRPSSVELEAVLARHPNIRDCTRRSYTFYKLTGQAIDCSLHYLLGLVDAAKADQFMQRLSTGVGLEQGNPILQLREILFHNLTARDKFSKRTIAALVIKAFNLWYEDKSVTRLRFGSDEAFPKIKHMPARVLDLIRARGEAA